MTRTILIAVAAATLLVAAASAEAADERRPNLLFAFADDWGYPHAGVYGDPTVQTPTFDRVAREGVLFHQAYVSSPSCTPSRGTVLYGQDFWRLGAAANLWPLLPDELVSYVERLAEAGYFVGHTGKGWGPGRIGERPHNPAGPAFADFAQFLDRRPDGQPFCFWFGGRDPHRGVRGDGAQLRRQMGVDPDGVYVPPTLPDAAPVREDIAEYYAQVQRFDGEVGQLLELLAERGELDTTVVVISSDHGWSFPRGKTQLYDAGTRVPLAVRWPDGVPVAGRTVTDFVNLTDLAPTFLELAGVDVPPEMTGRSLLPLLKGRRSGQIDPARDAVVTGRERHTPAQQAGNSGGYPMRAIRTARFLYIRNYRPDRWPAGTPDHQQAYLDGAWLGDTDNGQSKYYLWANRRRSDVAPLYASAFGRRPNEELYDVRRDPYQLRNLADDPRYADTLEQLSERLTRYLSRTGDPRELGTDEQMDTGEYFGGIPRWPGQEVIEGFKLPASGSRLSAEVDWEPGDRRRPAGRSQQRAK